MRRALVALGILILFFFAGCTGTQSIEKAAEGVTVSKPSSPVTSSSEIKTGGITGRSTTIELDGYGNARVTTELTLPSTGGLEGITIGLGGEYSDFRAFDANGELEVSTKEGGQHIVFGEQTGGEYTFSYQFVMPNFATVLGPKTAFNYQNSEGEKVTVKIPNAGFAREFTPDDILNFEHYLPIAYYYVEETNVFKSTTGTEELTINLPVYRDFQGQDVLALKVIPEPEETVSDEEGNLFAKINIGDLAAGVPKTVKVYSVVEVRAFEPMSYSEPPSYLAEDTYWDVESPAVSELAGKLKKGDSYETLKSDFEYVSKTLEYVYNPKRNGAEWALLNKKGDCEEFSDLFITLSKAQGIPAAEVVGIVYEGDKSSSIGHMWSWAKAGGEYLPVDASWGQFEEVDNLHIVKCFSGIETDVCGTRMNWEGASKVTMDSSFTIYCIPDIQRAAELTQSIRLLEPEDAPEVGKDMLSKSAGPSLLSLESTTHPQYGRR